MGTHFYLPDWLLAPFMRDVAVLLTHSLLLLLTPSMPGRVLSVYPVFGWVPDLDLKQLLFTLLRDLFCRHFRSQILWCLICFQQLPWHLNFIFDMNAGLVWQKLSPWPLREFQESRARQECDSSSCVNRTAGRSFCEPRLLSLWHEEAGTVYCEGPPIFLSLE